MIKHIVIWKLKENVSQDEILNLKELSKTLEKIKTVVDIKFNVSPADGSTHELCLESIHNNMDDLNSYSIDPVHLAFGKELKKLVSERICFNYEY